MYGDNRLITKVGNNTYFETEVDAGLVTFWAQTEQKATVSMNLVPGKSYYLRCSVVSGVWLINSHFEFVSEAVGISETSKMKKK